MSKKSGNTLEKLVNSSGFPFQIAIENLIRSNSPAFGWNILSREHPWVHPETDSSGYMDLLIEEANGVLVMLIECKRPQKADWIFLLPKGIGVRPDARFWITEMSPHKQTVGWFDPRLKNPTPESEFCVVKGQDERKTTLLERIGSELVEATEAIALEEIKLHEDAPHFRRLYVPLIVTTAQLRVCTLDYSNVSIENGEVFDCEFETVPFIRFRKSLSTRVPNNMKPSNIQQVAKANERSVFVVNSSGLLAFLQQFDIAEGPPFQISI